MTIEQRPVGNSGVSLSALSLGTVKFGRNQGVKYPGSFELPDDRALEELLAVALENGVTTLDTAPAYGIAEERLGKLIKQRRQWQIISKAGEFFDPASGKSHYDFRPASLNKSLETTLRRLGTDHLDCWLLHSDGNDCENLNDDVINTLLKAKQAGKARCVGASTKTIAGGRQALEQLDCIMMAASLEHKQEQALFRVAEQLNKGLLLKKIYDSGWALTQADKQQVMQKTLATLFDCPAVSSAVVGTINPVHLKENINAYLNRHDPNPVS